MSETTNAVVSTSTQAARAANKAGQKIIDTVVTAGEHTLPTVVETSEFAMAMDVPTKVVLNQRLIVGVSIVGGAAVGAGILFGVQKFRQQRMLKSLHKKVDETLVEKNATDNL